MYIYIYENTYIHMYTHVMVGLIPEDWYFKPLTNIVAWNAHDIPIKSTLSSMKFPWSPIESH